MKIMNVVSVLSLIALFGSIGNAYEIEGNPDRRMSIGLNYDRFSTTTEYTFGATKIEDFTDTGENFFNADLRIPTTRFLTLMARAGYHNSTNDTFAREKVKGSGYSFGVGARFFLP